MRNIITSLLLVCLFVITSKAQQRDSLIERPFQMSFFYPLSTNGLDATKYINSVSFNILYGVNGGLNGVEFGGLVNSNIHRVQGAQFAGIANLNAKTADGIMMAGIANVIGDSSNSVCAAGIANVIGGKATGVHMAGISNLVNGDYYGAQGAGIANVNNGNMIGIQGAGIANLNRGDFQGIQMAGISNFNGGGLDGAQLGLINRAKTVKGFQLGLINIANDFEKGVPLGLFSFVKKGYHSLELSTGDAIYANINLKLGVDKLYTIYKMGFAANGSDQYLTYGLGLGSKIKLAERFDFSVDASASQVVTQSFSPNLDLLNRVDLAVRYNIGEHFTVFAGPSLNVYVAQHNVDTESPALRVPYTLFTGDWGNNEGSTSIWVGANAGLSLNF